MRSVQYTPKEPGKAQSMEELGLVGDKDDAFLLKQRH